jgi:hypothetical protein
VGSRLHLTRQRSPAIRQPKIGNRFYRTAKSIYCQVLLRQSRRNSIQLDVIYASRHPAGYKLGNYAISSAEVKAHVRVVKQLDHNKTVSKSNLKKYFYNVVDSQFIKKNQPIAYLNKFGLNSTKKTAIA